MKIAMVTSWREACGIADYAAALVAALREQVDIQVVPVQAGHRRRGYFRELGRACNQADLAHVQHEYIYFGGRDPWSCRWSHFLAGLRVPHLVTAHTLLGEFPGGPWWKRGAKWARRTAYRLSGWTSYLEAGLFAPSRRILVHTASHRQALVARGLPPERVRVVSQGVPAVKPGKAAAARERWGLSGPVVTLFGFFNPAKGQLLALEAWERAAWPATLVVTGKAFSGRDAAYARRVEQAAARMPGRVRLLGFLPEEALNDLLAASTVVLMPYLRSTSSYALSYALAQGSAVLTSDLPAFREIRERTPCLEMFPSGDAAGLGARLRGLLADETRRNDLRRAAREWAAAHSWGEVARDTLAIYREILSENNGMHSA